MSVCERRSVWLDYSRNGSGAGARALFGKCFEKGFGTHSATRACPSMYMMITKISSSRSCDERHVLHGHLIVYCPQWQWHLKIAYQSTPGMLLASTVLSPMHELFAEGGQEHPSAGKTWFGQSCLDLDRHQTLTLYSRSKETSCPAQLIPRPKLTMLKSDFRLRLLHDGSPKRASHAQYWSTAATAHRRGLPRH